MKKPPAKSTIEVQGIVVSIVSQRTEDFICLTDIARFKDAQRTDYLISNWLRNRDTIEFLGIWERLNNPAFNPIEFDGIKMQAGLNSFKLSVKDWVKKTGAIVLRASVTVAADCIRHAHICKEPLQTVSHKISGARGMADAIRRHGALSKHPSQAGCAATTPLAPSACISAFTTSISNPIEFDGIRMQAGRNSFALTPMRCIERSKATRLLEGEEQP